MQLSSPHIHSGKTVGALMRQVGYALLPGIAVYVWLFGWGIVVNLALASAVALACEAAMLAARGRTQRPFITDFSAVLTGLLLALSIPPLAPWWVTLVGVAFAIIVAKHLYGGLGYNPFNPAMAGYVLLLISFPREMTSWLSPAEVGGHYVGLAEAARSIFGSALPAALTVDALSMATPLDTLKTQLGLNREVGAVFGASPLFGVLGGKGWEWINLAFALGGLWLIHRRAIGWHIPAAMLGALLLLSGAFHVIDPQRYAGPLFHLFSGATMLGAFFIATDPITACTTPRGRLLFGAGVGILVYVIRTFGGYPDGVAFGVLLMNMAAPTIDYYTRPRVFGR